MCSKYIAPNVIDVAPKVLAKVTYRNGIVVETGKELTQMQVKDKPSITWNGEFNALYTLLMVDPDATLNKIPSHCHICHWLVINIPGDDVKAGQTIVEYIALCPCDNNGLHRFMFLVFKQADRITSDKFVFQITREGHISVQSRDYMTKYNLGNPVAGNYYKARYDRFTSEIL